MNLQNRKIPEKKRERRENEDETHQEAQTPHKAVDPTVSFNDIYADPKNLASYSPNVKHRVL